MSAVTAMVIGRQPEWAGALPQRDVAAVVTVPSLAALPDAAKSAESELLWLLDSAARPDAVTLTRLLDAQHEPAASLPVDARGEPAENAIGRFTEEDVPALLHAVESRLVPLRHTRVLSLLIGRDGVLAEPPPDPAQFGGYAGNEWTNRLFARRRGMLVPASRITVGSRPPGRPLHALRAARSCGWGKGETLRELRRIAAG